jgi:hypothetical protein
MQFFEKVKMRLRSKEQYQVRAGGLGSLCVHLCLGAAREQEAGRGRAVASSEGRVLVLVVTVLFTLLLPLLAAGVVAVAAAGLPQMPEPVCSGDHQQE